MLTERGGGISACGPHCSDDEIIESLPLRPRVLALLRRVLRGLPAVCTEVRDRHVPNMSLTGCNKIFSCIINSITTIKTNYDLIILEV